MKAALWKLQLISLPNSSFVSGIIIKGSPDVHDEEDKSFNTFKKVIASYFIRPFKNKSAFIKYQDEFIPIETGANGEFRIEFNKGISHKISVHINVNEKELPLLQDYPVYFDNLNGENLVISDIDDTILHSYSTRSLKKLRSLLFRPPIKRKKIDSTHKAFESLKNSHFQFIYLSRSEYNLFNLISTFIVEKKFPLGPIFLRKFTRWKKLFNQKGKNQYKYQVLDQILTHLPENRIVFFGDDSQYDLDIYTHFAEKFPDRINKIFIHRTRGRIGKKEVMYKLEENSMIEKVVFYHQFDQIEDQLNTIINETIIRS